MRRSCLLALVILSLAGCAPVSTRAQAASSPTALSVTPAASVAPEVEESAARPQPVPDETGESQTPSIRPTGAPLRALPFTSPTPVGPTPVGPTPVGPTPVGPTPVGPGPAAPSPTRLPPRNWAEWPLIPQVSARAKEIYRQGMAMGNDPRAFSTIGDCQSEPPVFLGIYDSDRYTLPENDKALEETIQHFKASFTRDSITVKDGMSVASALSPMWADPTVCNPGETPLDCELRLKRPSIVFINLGTNWKGGNDATHEKYMRQIVDILLAHGVLPIFGTKGDNHEGDHRINQSIARVAYDYDLPLWNFWRSIRDLPGKGLDGSRDGNYLTPAAWGRRSFTGLQALDAVWRAVRE